MSGRASPHLEVHSKRFRSLCDAIGMGSTDFAKALVNFKQGHYNGKAISPELRAVLKHTETSKLVHDPDGIYPPLRLDNASPVTLPNDPENRRAFVKWFFGSLRSGKRLTIPLFHSNEELVVDSLNLPSMEGAHSRPPVNKKAKKTTTSKRKPHRIIESDDEDAPAPSQKKEKQKAVRPVPSARETQPPSDSEHDYEDEDGNLAGFVIADGETY